MKYAWELWLLLIPLVLVLCFYAWLDYRFDKSRSIDRKPKKKG